MRTSACARIGTNCKSGNAVSSLVLRRASLGTLCACALALALLGFAAQHFELGARALARRAALGFDRRRSAGGSPPPEQPPELLPLPAQPRRRVYFLKTHKCASSSIQRIILGYAMKHNLSVALPLHGNNIFFPRPFHPDAAKRTCSHPLFDVMAAHARFGADAAGFMPNDTFFVTVVRDPAEQMHSAYHYFLGEICDDERRQNATFEDYLAALAASGGGGNRSSAALEYPCGVGRLQFLQLYDFGLDLSPAPTREVVARKIDEIDEAFHLVLVVERLEESLVLMRDLLGWTTDDLLHFKTNYRLSPSARLSGEVRSLAYEWNWADKMLYDHFRAKMDAQIRRRGEAYVRQQALAYRDRQATFYERCVAAVVRDTVHKGNRSWSVNVSGAYVLREGGRRDASCQLAGMTELQLFQLINAAQPACRSAQR